MLDLHLLLLLPVAGLQLPQLILLLSKLLVELVDLLVIVSLLVQGQESLFLLSLDLKQGLILVLHLLQDALLVLKLILK